MAQSRSLQVWSLLRRADDGSLGKRMVAAATLSAAAGGFAALAPLALTRLIEAGTGHGSSHAPWQWLALYIALLAITRTSEQGQTYVFGLTDSRLQSGLAQSSFRHVMALPHALLLDAQAGALLQAQTQALQGVRTLLTQLLYSLAPAVVQAAIVLWIVAYLFDAWLLAVMLATMAAYACIFVLGTRRASGPTQAALEAQAAVAGLRADALCNVEVIKAAGAERNIAEELHRLLDNEEKSWRAALGTRLRTGFGIAAVFLIGFATVLTLGLLRLQAGVISIGDFVLLHVYMLQTVRPVEVAGLAIREIAQAVAFLSRWLTIADLPEERMPAQARAPSAASESRPCPAIRFQEVSFAYGDRQALRRVSFAMKAGEVTAVVGSSGAGKSTLARLLLGHHVPDTGAILFDGAPVDRDELHARRQDASVVNQEVLLFNRSLRYNLLFARPSATELELSQAIAKANLASLIARLPNGLDSNVGERGLKLSGGERQRVAIARALLQRGQLAILDEPTSALDSISEQAVSADLLHVAQGRTTLLITHRLALAARSGHIVVLRDGCVVEQGTHAALVRAPGAYSEMWKAQQQFACTCSDIARAESAAKRAQS